LKKYFALFILSFMIFTFYSNKEAEAKVSPEVYFNTQRVYFDTSPIVSNGRALIEFRTIFEALSLSNIRWDSKTNIIRGENQNIKIQLQIGSKTSYVNGKSVTLDTAPKVVNGRTMIPLRFVAEATGATVTYAKDAEQIDIYSKGYIGQTRQVTYDNWALQYKKVSEIDKKMFELESELSHLKSLQYRYVYGSDKAGENIQAQINILLKKKALLQRKIALLS
jgi:hypothetical protein